MAPLQLFLYDTLPPYFYQFEGFALVPRRCHRYAPNKNKSLMCGSHSLLLNPGWQAESAYIVSQCASTWAISPVVVVPG